MPRLAIMEVDKENAGRPATFSSAQLQQLVGNCLKLASENKITVQNTWSLPLIENLPNLIKDEGEQTNFQRASVTLDAGVKIYSTRVDSVHTETFKILGTMGRAGGGAESEEGGEEGAGEGEEGDGRGEGAGPKRRRRALVELNEAATLEANMDALTLKKFDLAFAVDPLFKKTSAQFDEGGAKGLLLNNLSVYNGCDIVFDSMDIPETAVDTAQDQPSMLVSLAAVQGKLDMVLKMTGQERISPTLDDILQLLGQAPGEGAAAAADEFVRQVATAAGDVQPTPSASLMQTSTFSGDGEECSTEDKGEEGYVARAAGAPAPGLADLGDYDDEYGDGRDEDTGGFDAGGGFDDYFSDNEGQESVAQQQQQTFSAAKGGRQSLGGDALQWLVSAGTLNMAGKGWAGGSHWRYRALPQQGAPEGEEDGGKKKRAVTRKKNDPLDFVALLEQPEQPTFEKLPAKPKRAKRARAAGARAAKPVALLPEDHHYQPEVLARYALRPRQAVRGRSGESSAGAAVQAAELCSQLDFGGDCGGGFSDGDDDGPADFGGWGDTDFGGVRAGGGGGDAGEEPVLAVRRVEKVEVNYSKAAKQVDVRALKETLWEGIHQVLPPSQQQDAVLSFQDVLSTVQERNSAGRVEDLSVHLCFICVLHLANEHGLVIKGVPELDRLTISNVPAA